MYRLLIADAAALTNAFDLVISSAPAPTVIGQTECGVYTKQYKSEIQYITSKHSYLTLGATVQFKHTVTVARRDQRNEMIAHLRFVIQYVRLIEILGSGSSKNELVAMDN